MGQTRRIGGAVPLVVAGVLWGCSFVLGKVALSELGPAHVALYRFLVASIVLAPIVSRVPLRREHLPRMILVGILMVPVTFLLQFAGLQRTTASAAALIIGTLPALIAVGSRAFLAERLGARGWGAAALTSLGAAITVGSPTTGDLAGNLLVLASLVSVVGWIMLGKRLLAHYPPVAAASWPIVLGTSLLVPAAVLLEGPPPLAGIHGSTWLAIVGLGLGCTAASTLLWNVGLATMPAHRAGLFLSIEPLTGATLGVLLLGEPLSLSLAIGGTLILVATTAMSRSRRAGEPTPPGAL